MRQIPSIGKIIEAFQQKTGCPVLVNTSFNVRGADRLHSQDSYRCFMRSEMDFLVLETCLLDKRNSGLCRDQRLEGALQT